MGLLFGLFMKFSWMNDVYMPPINFIFKLFITAKFTRTAKINSTQIHGMKLTVHLLMDSGLIQTNK
jgi:hypothetical protein